MKYLSNPNGRLLTVKFLSGIFSKPTSYIGVNIIREGIYKTGKNNLPHRGRCFIDMKVSPINTILKMFL